MRKILRQKIHPYERDLNKMLFKVGLIDPARESYVSGQIEFKTRAEFDGWMRTEYPGCKPQHLIIEPAPMKSVLACPILPMPSMVVGLPRAC